MFHNSVLKVNVSTEKWLRAAGIRAIKTIAQAALGGIGSALYMGQVDWKYVVSASLLAGIISILSSISGIPEVAEEAKSEATTEH